MMPNTILFDLDNTLLNSIDFDELREEFGRLFVEYLSPVVTPDRVIQAMGDAEGAIDANDGTDESNHKVFMSAFSRSVALRPYELVPIFEVLWSEGFPKLQDCWKVVPEAREVIRWIFDHGMEVVIATGMMFPKIAIEEKLSWAKIPVTEFDYSFITHDENMHASKPHPAYYLEVLENIGHQPRECLMVGDDWEHDVVPASVVGIPVYWIADEQTERPDWDLQIVGQGGLLNLLDWLRKSSVS
jgi:FMN phosphatase YigB (HAD superfamily)